MNYHFSYRGFALRTKDKKNEIFIGHLWHAERAPAAAAGFDKGIDCDFEPIKLR